MMSRQLFGTDGIRARAGQYPLDDVTMVALGRALARDLGSAPTILLGMDTRASCPQIARALASGIHAEGGHARLLGVIPTPGVAWLCKTTGANAGISISASHNPWEDNGVKVFGSDGMKLADSLELQIENDLLALRGETAHPADDDTEDASHLVEKYARFLIDVVGENALTGLKLVADAGNGAAFRLAGDVLRGCGAELHLIHDQPDGRNINEASGALHPETLAERVVEQQAAAGVAFDGDADRAIFVDDRGNIRDGDEILYLWALDLDSRGDLANRTVVATVMSNLGFEKKLRDHGIRLERASVGDKYVLEQMIELEATLGGEQSGHVIDLQHHTTGDGLLTALSIFAYLNRQKRRFSELETFEKAPQILLNTPVAAKPPLESLPEFQKNLRRYESELGSRGRILVRYSGTENLVRVMVEGEDQHRIDQIARDLSDVLKNEIR
jgi:phosphoglucosamine mutase